MVKDIENNAIIIEIQLRVVVLTKLDKPLNLLKIFFNNSKHFI